MRECDKSRRTGGLIVLNNSVPELFFLANGYVAHSFFIHLGISNLFGYSEFLSNAYLRIFFQLGIFVNVKALYDFTFFSDRFTHKNQATFSFEFKDVYLVEDTILNPGLTISSLMVSTITGRGLN